MRGTLIALGVLCWLIATRVVAAAITASHQANVEYRAHGSGGQYSIHALVYWTMAIAMAIAGMSLIRRAMRAEYKHVPPPQSTRDWDTYLAPKAKPDRPRRSTAAGEVAESSKDTEHISGQATSEQSNPDRPSTNPPEDGTAPAPAGDHPYRYYESNELIALRQDLSRSQEESSRAKARAAVDEDYRIEAQRGLQISRAMQEIDQELARHRATRQANEARQGGGPVEGQPYRYYESNELIALHQDLSRSQEESSRAKARAAVDEDYRIEAQRGLQISRAMQEIDQELARRRATRQANENRRGQS